MQENKNKILLQAINNYNKIIAGNTKNKYALIDINIIHDILKSFIKNNEKRANTCIKKVADFFKDNNFNVKLDNNNINYIILFE